MLELTYPLCDFIQVKMQTPRDTGWPVPSPFNLRFASQRLTDAQSAAIAGAGIYMISSSSEVVYVGLYKPARGNIIADRWGRHLQTITGRGHNIGLGGRDPTVRRARLLAAVSAQGLREAIEHAYEYSREDRFRDTGNNTTANRLRFASENWAAFSAARDNEILLPLTFWLFRIRGTDVPDLAAEDVKAMEKAVLGGFKPLCNDEYEHLAHAQLRQINTIPAITTAIRQAAIARTGEDISHRVQLAGHGVA